MRLLQLVRTAACLLLLAAPVPAHAQAGQLVTAIAQYVGLTAASAEVEAIGPATDAIADHAAGLCTAAG